LIEHIGKLPMTTYASMTGGAPVASHFWTHRHRHRIFNIFFGATATATGISKMFLEPPPPPPDF
jgi:hypothetical protein